MTKKPRRKPKPQIWQRSQLKLEILKGRAEWLERELKATKKKLVPLKRGKPKATVRSLEGRLIKMSRKRSTLGTKRIRKAVKAVLREL